MPDPSPLPCAAEARWLRKGPLPALDDPEGDRVPAGAPPIIDAHVHLFPDGLFEAIWRWFDAHGWPVRYRLHARAVIRFLLDRGVDHVVALHYAHKPGLARAMNAFMAEVCAAEPQVTGLATVLPGEPDAGAILRDAFAAGLRGVKLHCHVQCFAPDDPRIAPVYEACASAGLPLVMHAGREPASPAYRCDPYAVCGVERVEAVLREWPSLRLCVPHLGADELPGYARLLERYDTLWLDTTMTMAGYFGGDDPLWMLGVRPDRVLYGTDFPNLPYAWDRELLRLLRGCPERHHEALFGGVARGLFGLPQVSAAGTTPPRPA